LRAQYSCVVDVDGQRGYLFGLRVKATRVKE